MAPIVDFQLEFNPPQEKIWTEFAEQFGGEQLQDEGDLVHRKTVIQVLRSMILMSPVDSGRFRAAWCPYLNKHGVQWKALLEDQRLVRSLPTVKGPKGKRTQIEGSAIQKGLKEGVVKERPLDTTIINNVVYGVHLESRFGFVRKVMDWAKKRQQENYQAWFEAMRVRVDAGKPDVAVGTNPDTGKLIG